MRKQIDRPVRRTETQKTTNGNQKVWPLSARQFMKLPLSELLSASKRLTFSRIVARPDEAA